jgi:hypothetical protein
MRAEEETDRWLAERKQAAKLIDPTTAEIRGQHGQVVNPYGVRRLPRDADCVGRNVFVRNRGSDEWVWDGDLPDEKRKRLWERPDEDQDDEIPF